MQLASEPQSPPPVNYSAGDAAVGQQADAVDPSTLNGVSGVSSISQQESPDPNAAAALTLPVRANSQDADVHESSRTAFRAELEAHVAAGHREWPEGHPELNDL